MMIKSKKIIFIFSLILFLFILVGCKNNVTRDNYDKITLYMEKEEVIEILGEPTETVMNIHNDEYYWFSEGRSIDEAFELAKDGKEIKYIIVVFSVELTNKSQIVLNKKFGYVSELIGDDK